MTSPGKDRKPLPTHDFEEHPEITELLASLDAPPMPDDVAERLNRTITAEAAARRTAPRTHVRKLALAWGGAAAAVLAVVVGGSVLLNQMNVGMTSADSSAAGDAKTAMSTSPSPQETSQSTESTESSESADADKSAPPDSPGATNAPDQPVPAMPSTVIVLRPDHLAEDVQRMLPDRESYAAARGRVSAQDDVGCAGKREPGGDRMVFDVTYEAEPAVLVVTNDSPQVATVYSCDGTELDRTSLD